MLALASCSSDENEMAGNGGTSGKGITIIAKTPGVNNSRTAIINEDGKICPVWSGDEKLYVSAMQEGTAKKGIYVNTSAEQSKTAAFTYGSKEEIDFTKATDVCAVVYKNDMIPLEPEFNNGICKILFDNSTAAFGLGTATEDNDILVSRKISSAAEMVNNGTISMEMKRISSFVRIIAKGSQEWLSGDELSNIQFVTENSPIAGFFQYDFNTEKGIDIPTSSYYLSVRFDNVKASIDGTTETYFCMKPSVISHDDILSIIIKTKKGKEFVKKIKPSAEGIRFEEGKIQTIILDLNEKSVDQTKAPEITRGNGFTPGCITVTEAGHLNTEHFISALGTSEELKIIGDMNAADFSALRIFLASDFGKTFYIDLSDVNIIGGDGSEFFDSFSLSWKKIETNGIMPRKLLSNANYMHGIELPNTVSELERGAVSSKALRFIVFGTGTKKLAQNCVSPDFEDGEINVAFMAKPSDDMMIAEDFLELTGSVKANLILHEAWKYHADAPAADNSWFGTVWNSISYGSNGKWDSASSQDLFEISDEGNILY